MVEVKNEDINSVFSLLEKDHQPTMLELLKNYTEFQQLVATLLSSRTKDSTTIPIVKKLFRKYPKPKSFISVDLVELEKELYGIGFYKVKARHIKELSRIIINKYKNEVPGSFNKLIELPGVGRKTANCVLNYTFGVPAIGVDTHVHRIINRVGWIKSSTPLETEEKLMKLLPKKMWKRVNMLLVNHGQSVCFSTKPNCGECSIREYCGFV